VGLVPFGSIGMTLFAVDLYFASRGLKPTGIAGLGAFFAEPHWRAHLRVLGDLLPLRCSRLLFVPLYALIQGRCEPTHRARSLPPTTSECAVS
jgi:hypothetical protein